MNQVQTEKVRWTVRDLEVLPDNEWVRYEIIDGELFVTRAPILNISIPLAEFFGCWMNGLTKVV